MTADRRILAEVRTPVSDLGGYSGSAVRIDEPGEYWIKVQIVDGEAVATLTVNTPTPRSGRPPEEQRAKEQR